MSFVRRRPSEAELGFFRAAVRRLGVTNREAEAHLSAADVPRSTVLLSTGDVPDLSGLVVSGVVREYYLQPDGTEHTRHFALAGDAFGSISDAIAGRPVRAEVCVESDAVVLLLPWPVIEQLAARSREWERCRHRIVEELLVRRSTREYELLALDAMGRYLSLLEQHPRIEEAVPQRHIASYLGITPVHLSRLRRRRRLGSRANPGTGRARR
ncbi:Crp/Fnr family transcriptional regulator [Pyxidicoccus parkwayensis]|uniref:Crp/Fnr family transcriptional regulator n=1 Tax=Pyxidicoccus parkwayensis TaxID=2813578 RepID=A0ABX7P9G7_9BACT|nr:Crp/Fnr family transcriptional regulator [Pyxidicoccus parkwaysis]QSQ27080.1 Crp/Fnr family transcriptional regulator [Pyxidicoccus parkwaysis]